MADDAIDAALMAAFATPPPSSDPAFVRRIERAVRAEAALRAAREHAWRQFGCEALGIAAIALVCVPLWKSGEFAARMAAPEWAAIILLGMWAVTMLRPVLRDEQ